MNIFDIYRQNAHVTYIGEHVSQLEHASQAGQLALEAMADPEVVLAAFLHDIGHLCADAQQVEELGRLSHEKIGAEFLRAQGLPERVVRLTESHVEAKRYLCWKDPEYHEGLSDASQKTLEQQGGPMLPKEAVDFESDPDFEAILQLRRWDDLAKKEAVPVADLAIFEYILNRLLPVD